MNTTNDWVPIPQDFWSFFKLHKNKRCLQLYFFILLNAEHNEGINPDGSPRHAGDYIARSHDIYNFLGMSRIEFRRAMKLLSDNHYIYFKGAPGKDTKYQVLGYTRFICSNCLSGFAKLFREVSSYEWFMDGNIVAVYTSLLLRLNTRETLSLRDISKEVLLDIPQVLKCMSKLRYYGILKYNKKCRTDVYAIQLICNGLALPYYTQDSSKVEPKLSQSRAKVEPLNYSENEGGNCTISAQAEQTSVENLGISKNKNKIKTKINKNIKNNTCVREGIQNSSEVDSDESQVVSSEEKREAGFVASLKSNNVWQQSVLKNLDMEKDGLGCLNHLIDQFILDNQCTLTFHSSLTDFARHFVRWAALYRQKEIFINRQKQLVTANCNQNAQQYGPVQSSQGQQYRSSLRYPGYPDIPFWDKDTQREWLQQRRLAKGAELVEKVLHEEDDDRYEDIRNW